MFSKSYKTNKKKLMKIIKTNGNYQSFMPNKILARIKAQCKDLQGVDADLLFQKIVPNIKDGMTSTQIDEIIAYKAADLIVEHPDYSLLGGRILLTRQAKRIGKECQAVDLTYDLFGAVTFLKKYSVLDDDELPLELPSCMYERVGNFLGNDTKERKAFIDELKSKRISLATPILTNAGTSRKVYSSCNLTCLVGDSLEGIQDTLTSIAKASKEGAGIGLLIDPIRSRESLVSSFKGKAGGVVRLADMVQSTMRFYKQGTRSGSCALYLSVWHRDIMDFLELRLPVGDEKLRARDLFTGIIINDNFMRALINDTDWYLFCPKDIEKAGLTALHTLWGEEYEKVYNNAVELGLGYKISPKKIWDAIIKSCIESGTPYVMFKDNVNRNNMQSNIGTIMQSNLCIEVMQVSRPNYVAQCILGLINLKEHDQLSTIEKSTTVLTTILNRVIDKNVWPDEAAKAAGKEQRAIAIGVAGLADLFAKKSIPFAGEQAKSLNKEISKAIYITAIETSEQLAHADGCYPAWEGSPYQNGITLLGDHGREIRMRNSLVTGYMPSASTSILLGAQECFEPYTSNIFVRSTGAGEFLVVNKYLVEALEEEGLWTADIRNAIIQDEGSVQNIPEIPQHIKDVFKTMWEIPQKEIINMAADRQKHIDQSQSMNLYFNNPDYAKISGALKYGWEQGLKTGVYYTRTERRTDKPKRLFSNTTKPAESLFECVGCSS